MNTDISIDENSLIMYLKYGEKPDGRTPFEFEISDKFNPFDKNYANTLATKSGKKLNKSSILIKSRYGEVYSIETLAEHLEKFKDEMIQIDPHAFPKHTPNISQRT